MSERPDYRFADMHCHIMPQVDDGSESMEMSLNMLRIAEEENIETIILTPHNRGGHHNVTLEGIDSRIEALYEATDRNDLFFDFYPGNEIMYDSTVVERLNRGEICTMADSDYVLVEFKPWEEYAYIREALRKLSYEGFIPILAHCERYECLVRDTELVEELFQAGVYLQLNAEDCIPKLRGNAVPKFCNQLLEEGLISFIGTDAHKDYARTPRMMKCWEHLDKKYDYDYVREIMRENTLMVIDNKRIPRE